MRQSKDRFLLSIQHKVKMIRHQHKSHHHNITTKYSDSQQIHSCNKIILTSEKKILLQTFSVNMKICHIINFSQRSIRLSVYTKSIWIILKICSPRTSKADFLLKIYSIFSKKSQLIFIHTSKNNVRTRERSFRTNMTRL